MSSEAQGKFDRRDSKRRGSSGAFSDLGEMGFHVFSKEKAALPEQTRLGKERAGG